MANYVCTVRTNYFHVKDAETFRAVMEKVQGSEDNIKLWEEKDPDGNPVFGFGCDGGIAGIPEVDEDGEEEITDNSYDNFLFELQNAVAENDAIIITEVGHEKQRYVVGTAVIITQQEIACISITDLALQKAREMLNNPLFKSRMDY